MTAIAAPLFPDHTVDTAPQAARRAMAGVAQGFGYLPVAVGRLAESPETLDAFLRISATFEAATLDPIAREVLVMTVATRNRCHLCVAIHTGKLMKYDADPALVAALRDGTVLPDPRLEALRRFVHDVMDAAGGVSDERIREFLAFGFTARNALEVVLGIGAYTLSTFANRLIDAPLDPPMAALAWEESH
nr:carboxymuconolactone decarboxylase family protein [Streptomyces sp.]